MCTILKELGIRPDCNDKEERDDSMVVAYTIMVATISVENTIGCYSLEGMHQLQGDDPVVKETGQKPTKLRAV